MPSATVLGVGRLRDIVILSPGRYFQKRGRSSKFALPNQCETDLRRLPPSPLSKSAPARHPPAEKAGSAC
jgi:hypothetical protein